MVSNGEFSLQGEWNAAVRLSLCCEQLSLSVAKEKKENRSIRFSGTSGSWVATLLQLISVDILRRGKLDTPNKMLIGLPSKNLNCAAHELTFLFPLNFPFRSGSCRPVAQCVFLFYNQEFEKKSCS